MVGKSVGDVCFEGLTIVGDFLYDRLNKGEKSLHFGGSNEKAG